MAANQHRERLREATQFIKQGDHKSAQAIFRELIKASPRDAELWYLYSFAVTERAHQIKSLEKVLALTPDHEKARQRLAQLRGEAPIPPKAPAKPATPSYALLAGGGLVSLVVVILIGFVLNRAQQNAEALITVTQPPTATLVIVTRKPTDESDAAPIQAVVAAAPTFVPISTRPPTSTMETPTPAQVEDEFEMVNAPLVEVNEFGGGTGRILYPYEAAGMIFSMIDLRDGSISKLDLPNGVQEAQWIGDGLQLMLSKEQRQECEGVVQERVTTTPEPCLGFMTVNNGSVMMIPGFPMAEYPALSPNMRRIVYGHPGRENSWNLWIANIDGTNQRQLTDGIPEPKDPVWSPDGKLIAYWSDDFIYVMRPDGSDHRAIAAGRMPAWSPDSKSLAYVYDAELPYDQISVIDVNGDNEQQIFINGENEYGLISWPIWSPDGKLIAFVRSHAIYVMRANGSDVMRMAEIPSGELHKPSWQPLPVANLSTPTPTPTATAVTPSATPLSIEVVGGGTGAILFYEGKEGQAADFRLYNLRDGSLTNVALPPDAVDARWSRDGRQILVRRAVDGPCIGAPWAGRPETPAPCVGIVDAQTLALTLLPNLPATLGAALSPDGGMIAFGGLDENNTFNEDKYQVWVARADGREAKQITNLPDGINQSGLQWTPDGRFIAYAPYLSQDIHLVALDGSDNHLLIQQASDLNWSADGSMLVFTASVEGNRYIYTAHADGTNRRQLTFNEANGRNQYDYNPVWSPDGKLIAFARGGSLYVSLYVMRADGTEQRMVVEGLPDKAIRNPSWQPPPANAFLPTYTPIPSLTPSPTAFIPTAAPVSGSTVGGGTGRLMYNFKPSFGDPFTFRVLDLNDMSTSDKAFQRDITDAQWLADGKRYLVNRDLESMWCRNAGNLKESCVGLMDSSTSEIRWIKGLPHQETVAVSPDMNMFAYVSGKQIFVSNLDGTNARQLTHYDDSSIIDLRDLAWSPDGKFIAYAIRAVNPRIDRVSLEGSDEAVFIPNAMMPAWSPDGTSLAYVSTGLFVANADGTNPRPIAVSGRSSYKARWPAWSPDSKLIAFAIVLDDQDGLAVAHADGSGSTIPVMLEAGQSLFKVWWQWPPSSSDALWQTATPVPTSTPIPTQPPLAYGPNDVPVFSSSGRVVANLYSSPGDWIGAGRGSFVLEGNGSVRSTGWGVSMTVAAEDGMWTFEFFAPNLQVGQTVHDATRPDVSEGGPEMDVGSDGRGCNRVLGDFTVEQVTPDLVISFTQHCDSGSDEELSGTLIFQAE